MLKVTREHLQTISYICALMCMLYFWMYGTSKLSNLGTDLSSGEFRAMGFDDIPVFWALALDVNLIFNSKVFWNCNKVSNFL